jgi:hypothetical protein
VFGEECGVYLRRISDAISEGDDERICREAATLSGVAGRIGAEAIAKVAGLVAQAAGNKEIGESRRLYADLESEIGAFAAVSNAVGEKTMA